MPLKYKMLSRNVITTCTAVTRLFTKMQHLYQLVLNEMVKKIDMISNTYVGLIELKTWRVKI